MFENLRLLSTALSLLRTHLRHPSVRDRDASDAGYSTEAILVTALLVAVALAALALLSQKILTKAGSIDLG